MGKRSLPDLTGRMRLDNSQLKKAGAETRTEIKGIEAATGRLGTIAEKSFGKFTSSATSSMGTVGGQAKTALDGIASKATQSGNLLGAGIAGGALLGGAALGQLAIKGIAAFQKLADEQRGLQRLTGASAEEAGKLNAALRATGTDSAVAEKGLFILSKTVENTPDKLSKVGIEIARQKDGSVDLFATLGNVANAYQRAGKGAEGNAIAAAAFGKSGAALLPILGKTREELDAIAASAKKRGLILDQDQLNQALKFKLAMRDLGQSVQGLEISMGSGLVPVLSTVIHGFTTIVDKTNSVTKSVGGLGGILGRGIAHINPLTGLISELGDAHHKAGDGAKDHAAAEEDLTSQLEQTAAQVDAETKALNELLDAQLGLVDQTLGLEGAQRSYSDALDDVKVKQADLTTAVHDHGAKSKEAADATKALSDAQFAAEQAAAHQAAAVVALKKEQAEATGVNYDASQQLADYKTALQEAANQADGPTKTAIQNLLDKVNALPDAKNIAINVVGAEKALAQFREIEGVIGQLKTVIPLPGLPGIPGRMAGGPVAAGSPYVVGEAGPELFVPNITGRILPTGSVPVGQASGGTSTTSHAADLRPIEVTLVLDGEVLARKTVRHNDAALQNRGRTRQ